MPMEISNIFKDYIYEYKYAGIFLLFFIDTLGVFLPSKTLLTITGILVQKGFLSLLPVYICALGGSLSGFSVSYTIGRRLGNPFLDRYGRFIRLNPSKINRARTWFNRYGPPFIIIAYFIPGLRHVTPYLAGISTISPWKALTYATIGAMLWITIFNYLGQLLGAGL